MTVCAPGWVQALTLNTQTESINNTHCYEWLYIWQLKNDDNIDDKI
jgi:hypothetical protein